MGMEKEGWREKSKNEVGEIHVLAISGDDAKYGAQTSMKQMIKALCQKDETIKISIVIPPNKGLAAYYQGLGCAVYQVPYASFYVGYPVQKWKHIPKFLISGIKYWFGRIAAVSILNCQLNMDEIDLIHINESRCDFGAVLAKKYKKPLIWHIREFGRADYQCFSLRKNYVGYMNQATDRFPVISEAVRREWIKKGIDEKKLVRIYNGVDKELFVKKVHFVLSGSLNPTKGQEELVDAIYLLPKEYRTKAHFYIIGDGNKAYIRNLKEKLEKYGNEELFSFLGYQKNLARMLECYDCGLMCSNSEGFGRVTIEYMMAGLPVIAADTGANPELIVEKENGLLYQKGNPQSLADCIVWMIEHPAERQRMGSWAREYAARNFSAERNAEEIMGVYENVLRNRNVQL